MSSIAPSPIVTPRDRSVMRTESRVIDDEPTDVAPYLRALENARTRLIRRMTSAPALHALVEGWHGAQRNEGPEHVEDVAILRHAVEASAHLTCAPVLTSDRQIVAPSPHPASRLLRVRETAGDARPVGMIVVRDGGGTSDITSADLSAAPSEPALVVTLADLAGLHQEIVTRRAPLTCVRLASDGAYAIDALRLFEIAAFSIPAEELREQTFTVARETLVQIGAFAEPAANGSTGRLHLNASALRQEMLPHRPSPPYIELAHAA